MAREELEGIQNHNFVFEPDFNVISDELCEEEE